MPFAFLLFAILGWTVFAQPAPSTARTVLMVVFVVLMAVWLIFGITGFEMGRLRIP
jgi:uncharacterized membrane protein